MKNNNIITRLKKEGHLDKKLYKDILNSLETFTNKEIDIVQDIIQIYNNEFKNEKNRILREKEEELKRINEEHQKEAIRIKEQEEKLKIEKVRKEKKKQRIGLIREKYQFIEIDND